MVQCDWSRPGDSSSAVRFHELLIVELWVRAGCVRSPWLAVLDKRRRPVNQLRSHFYKLNTKATMPSATLSPTPRNKLSSAQQLQICHHHAENPSINQTRPQAAKVNAGLRWPPFCIWFISIFIYLLL
ncbi:hypothetical protein JG688_00017709, partial [Phytophthora aleatoria]